MSTIGDRILEVVLYTGLNKTQFGKKINLSQSMISKLCAGLATPSDRTISDICRVFTINEKWLRTGDGDMVNQQARNELIDNLISIMLSNPPNLKEIVFETLSRLPDSALSEVLTKYDAAAATHISGSADEPKQ